MGTRALPAVRALPLVPGVYRFRDGRGRALYIGRAAELRRRVGSYWGDLRDRPRMRRMIPRIDTVEAVSCDSEHEAAWLERNLLEESMPPFNRVAGGLESVVYIGLDRNLEVRHDGGGPGLVFGPYLGGEKVRLAVSGLSRVLPMAYAGARLGGFDRDLARVRGIQPGSRADLVASLTAVLLRDRLAGAWVRSRLEERRAAAAAALAFELAGRIHAEIEALDWVLAEQKVAGPETADDAEVHGWSDGTLVSFVIREGRVRSWAQAVCDQAAAQARLQATPAHWRPFAQRNAALAASLQRATA
jgi:excinuclease ABC subunit C